MSSLTFRKIRQRTKRTKRLVRKMSTLGKTRMLNCMMGLIQTAGAQGDYKVCESGTVNGRSKGAKPSRISRWRALLLSQQYPNRRQLQKT